MGRYYPDDQSPDNTGVMDSLTANINNVGHVILQKKLQENQQKQKMKQVINAVLLKNKTLRPGADPNQVYDERTGNIGWDQLQDAPVKLGRGSRMYPPEQGSGSSPSNGNGIQIGMGNPSGWKIPGSEPTIEDVRAAANNGGYGRTVPTLGDMAQTVSLAERQRNNPALGRNLSPSRLTQYPAHDQSNDVGFNSGIHDQSNDVGFSVTANNILGNNVTAQDNQLPNAADYEEGTIVADEQGKRYKVTNGQWIPQ